MKATAASRSCRKCKHLLKCTHPHQQPREAALAITRVTVRPKDRLTLPGRESPPLRYRRSTFPQPYRPRPQSSPSPSVRTQESTGERLLAVDPVDVNAPRWKEPLCNRLAQCRAEGGTRLGPGHAFVIGLGGLDGAENQREYERKGRPRRRQGSQASRPPRARDSCVATSCVAEVRPCGSPTLVNPFVCSSTSNG
jgi:hypothetical protein